MSLDVVGHRVETEAPGTGADETRAPAVTPQRRTKNTSGSVQWGRRVQNTGSGMDPLRNEH